MIYNMEVRQHEDGTYYLECADLPEMQNSAFETYEKAHEEATTVFLNVLEHEYRRKGRAIPMPEKQPESETVIDVDAVTQCRLLLWNLMQKMDVTASWVSRRANLSRQEISRIMDFTASRVHAYKIEEVIHALGYSVEVTLFEF